MSVSSITFSGSLSAAPASRTGCAAHAAVRRDTRAPQEASGGPPPGPRQLSAALRDTLAATAGSGADLDSDAVRDALADFSGELFDALRTEGGREVGHGPGRHLQRGHAWGHWRGGDLGARIEALAAKLGAGSTAPAVAVDPPAQPAAPSMLETSFAALWQALNPDAVDTTGADLASFLNALAARLGGSEPASLGGFVDTTA